MKQRLQKKIPLVMRILKLKKQMIHNPLPYHGILVEVEYTGFIQQPISLMENGKNLMIVLKVRRNHSFTDPELPLDDKLDFIEWLNWVSDWSYPFAWQVHYS